MAKWIHYIVFIALCALILLGCEISPLEHNAGQPAPIQTPEQKPASHYKGEPAHISQKDTFTKIEEQQSSEPALSIISTVEVSELTTDITELTPESMDIFEPENTLPENCLDEGLLSESQCVLCDSIPDAECASTDIKTKNDGFCFECVEQKASCDSLGLLSENDCSICDSISGAECLPSSIAGCFECVQAPQSCADTGSMNLSTCEKNCTTEENHCVSFKTVMDETCYQCETTTEPIPEAEAIPEPEPIPEPEAIAKPTPKTCEDYGLGNHDICAACEQNTHHQCVKQSVKSDNLECFACEEHPISCADFNMLSENECDMCSDKEICEGTTDSDTGLTCYNCLPKPPECHDAMLLEKEECENVCATAGEECVAKENEFGLDCYACQPKEEICSDRGWVSKNECGRCPSNTCTVSGKLNNETECYSCSVSLGSSQCEPEGYLQNCNSCSLDENTCVLSNVVLFDYSHRNLGTIQCYECLKN